ncbi:MAG: alpha/beta hydrolase [Bacteroidota bacterium]
MKKHITLLILLISTTIIAQEKSFTTTEIGINSLLNGTLYTPKNITKKTKLVILIAGSGPTDRNGNQSSGSNNSLKFLAEALAQNDIAVFSYDKRLFAQMKAKNLDEKTLRFDDFIQDATDVISYFKSQKTFAKIIVAGHSEGSLIGMVAAKNNTDGYISLEGAGRPINLVLSEQLAKQAPAHIDEANGYLELLSQGKTFENKNIFLASLFRESVQPYLISWMKYNPQGEIKKLKIPILLVNGTKDIQTTEKEAYLLKEANPKATLKIIENMNHIFKEIRDDADNLKSYSNPNLPIMKPLVDVLIPFINSI